MTVGDGIIGIGGELPLRVLSQYEEAAKKDMDYFKRHTQWADIVMGWNTWVSLGQKPLKNRGTHYVITSRTDQESTDEVVFLTLKEFEDIRLYLDEDELWVIGGAKLYDTYLKHCDSVYWTHLELPADELNKLTAGKELTKVDMRFKDGFYKLPMIREDVSPDPSVQVMMSFYKLER